MAVVSAALVLFSVTAAVMAAPRISSSETVPAEAQERFAAGQIIVKFKAEADVGAVADELLRRGQPFAVISGRQNLDRLNFKYKVSRFRRLFDDDVLPDLPPGHISREEAQSRRLQIEEGFRNKVKGIRRAYADRHRRAAADRPLPYLAGIYRITLDIGADVAAAAEEYAADPDVAWAQPNHKHRLLDYPDDPYFSSSGSWGQSYDDLWGIKKIQAPGAWGASRGYGAIVAVIDTGVDYNHEDLAANILRDGDGNIVGYDFSDGDGDPADYHGHGSHCAGTVAAVGGNAVGVIGVAPEAKIMPVKIFPDAYDDVCAQGLRFAADNGADVLSNSWGPSSRNPSDPLLEDAVAYAWALGCVVVFAAGNDWDDVAWYSPANHPDVMAVAATDHNDVLSDFSNYGRTIAVSAPGGDSFFSSSTRAYANILSLRAAGTDMYGDGVNIIGQNYYRSRGTSMACPHAAGVAALVISRYPDWPNSSVKNQVIYSADPIDALNPSKAGRIGYGRINASRALSLPPGIAVEYAGHAFHDDAPGGNGDGLLSPGESVSLEVSLDVKWGAAANVRAVLGSADPLVTITKATSEYGDVPGGRIAANAADPFTFSLAAAALPIRAVNFTLAVTADGYFGELSFTAVISPRPLPGWPVAAIASPSPHVAHTIADVDRDGADEVALSAEDKIVILEGSGAAKPGWPVFLAAGSIIGRAAAGDIDGDGDVEIVAPVLTAAGHGLIAAWHQENGSPPAGWPVDFGPQSRVTDLALGDVSGGPALEVIAGVASDTGFEVHALESDGGEALGWPAALLSPQPSADRRDVFLAVGDMDADGRPEISAAIQLWDGDAPMDSPLFVLNADGTTAAGWPMMFDGTLSPPVLGNVDGGQDLELIVDNFAPVFWGYREGLLYAFKSGGETTGAYPAYTAYALPSPGDIDGSGYPNVVAASGEDFLGAFRDLGDTLWQTSRASPLPAVLEDIDGDGGMEILYLNRDKTDWRLAALDRWGKDHADFLIRLEHDALQPPSLGDLNGDGKLDLVLSDSGKVYAYNLAHPVPAAWSWPMAEHDPTLSNRHIAPSPALSAMLTVNKTGAGGVTVNYASRPLPWLEMYRRGAEVPLLARPEDGWYFDGWQGGLSGGDPEALVNMSQDVSVTARFNACLDIASAVDDGGLWISPPSGDIPWCGRENISHDGSDAAWSNKLLDNQKSVLATEVIGPVVVNFWWKISSEPNYDFLTFAIDDRPQLSISGEADWSQQGFTLSEGSHSLSWTYAKDNYYQSGADSAWLDQVEIIPPENTRTLTVNREGDGEIIVNGQIRALPWTARYPIGDTVLIEAKDVEGWSFTGWEGGVTGTQNPIPAPVNQDIEITAVFGEAVPLDDALDTAGLNWARTGNRWWFGLSGVGHDGVDAAASGRIGNNQSSVISTRVAGPAVLIFYWRVSSEQNWDFFSFAVDGSVKKRISGEVGWTRERHDIPEGIHDLSWVYAKDGNAARGQDRAWLDQVAVLPLNSALNLGKDGPGNVKVNGALRSLPWRETFATGTLVTLEAVPDNGHYLLSWSGSILPPAETVSLAMDGDQTITARFVPNIPLAESLDADGQVWETSGDAAWFGQAAISNNGNDAAASGRISHGQSSVLTTTVNGPAWIGFQWRVSSEANRDRLTFTVDEKTEAAVSGLSFWNGHTALIPDGPHRLSWIYSKDASGSSGYDRGWLDRVEFTPIAPLFSDDFSHGDRRGDPDWSVVGGLWKVTRKKLFVSSAYYKNRALIKAVNDFAAGIVEADIVLTSVVDRYPNAFIIFDYQWKKLYRWIRLTSNGISIGQTGVMGGEGGGLKAHVDAGFSVGDRHRLKALFHKDGLVEIEIDGIKYPASYRFTPVPGKVGIRTIKAKTLFDNVRLWSDEVLDGVKSCQ